MMALTAFGAVGAFVAEPFIGVAVYYLFAVLRPQSIWQWALPIGVSWSEMVAWATIAATGWYMLTSPRPQREGETYRRLTAAHKAVFAFGIWISFTYLTSRNQNAAWPWFIEYIKIFLMFAIASVVVHQLRQVWILYLSATIALSYLAYELNFLYFTVGRLDIYRNGYGGLDNNGAGLMLAMGVPLALYAWEASTRVWRWAFIAAIPLLIHAVLMSYSRGAMVALLAAAPLMIVRSTRRGQFALVLPVLLACVPILAGKEIREEFFSVEDYDADSSANSRFDSWAAAVRIANDYPVFGIGIRNSPLYSYEYGADIEGRVIHSQFLQTLADAGYPGLMLYLIALGTLWVSMSRTRRLVKKRDGPEAQRARCMINGIEGAMAVFCIGGSFLSLEVFELPYVLVLIGAQTSLLVRFRTAEEPASVVVPTAAVQMPIAPQRA